jgi:two-component system sensor histidine kinase MtrB
MPVQPADDSPDPGVIGHPGAVSTTLRSPTRGDGGAPGSAPDLEPGLDADPDLVLGLDPDPSPGRPASRPLSQTLTAPVRWWRSSLSLRVVALATAGSLMAVLAAGFFLVQRVADSIVVRSREAALTDASQALDQIEQAMRTSGVDLASPSRVTQIASDAIQRGAVGQRYEVWVVTLSQSVQSSELDESTIPGELRQAVLDEPRLVHSVPTTVHYRDARRAPAPGLAVGSSVSGPGAEQFFVFFAFPLTQEEQTLRVVQTALVVSDLAVVLGIGLVSYSVARQTLRPLRVARRAAERLAAGELTQPMPVKGTDDLARLAVSMNHMASQLQQRIGELEELSRLQQRFVADVSHELRTPLTTVRMAADVLYDQSEEFDAIGQRSAVLMRRELDRFEALLADLLEISRFDAGAAVRSLDEADLVELVRTEVAALSQLSRLRGSEIDFHPAMEVCLAQVDVRRISRLVRNLLSNAIEHGEGRPVDVSLVADETTVALSVRDHGVGFGAEEAKQLFNRFWRADPSRTRRIGGTGLGLAISREDVHLHQGWIHAWGRPGQGAHFRVTLPRTPNVVVTHSPVPLVPEDALEPHLVPSPRTPAPSAASGEDRS